MLSRSLYSYLAFLPCVELWPSQQSCEPKQMLLSLLSGWETEAQKGGVNVPKPHSKGRARIGEPLPISFVPWWHLHRPAFFMTTVKET